MLDAHQLHVFLTAAETLNFTVAARQLHMTQPSVSQHIQALEEHFQTELFVRQGRQMVLTDAGAALVPLARRLVDWSVRIDETMESLRGEVYGHLKLGCSMSCGKYVLPILLTRFMQLNPQVTATCEVMSRRQAMEELCDGLVHLALGGTSDFCAPVEFRKLFSDPIRLIAPLGHPWTLRAEIEPQELLEATYVLRDEGSGTHEATTRALAEVGVNMDQLRRVLTVGTSEAVALAVDEGLGVGFVSQIVAAHLARGRLAAVRVRGLEMHQDVYIGRNTALPGTTAQNAFWDFVTDPENAVLAEYSAQWLGHGQSLAARS
jgi:DNA-binding transcriptional LysR family regulator